MCGRVNTAGVSKLAAAGNSVDVCRHLDLGTSCRIRGVGSLAVCFGNSCTWASFRLGSAAQQGNSRT